jgi:hypothetical protein
MPLTLGISQGHRETTGRAKGEGESEGYGKEEARYVSTHVLYMVS